MNSNMPDDDTLDRQFRRFLDLRAEELALAAAPASAVAALMAREPRESGRRPGIRTALLAAAIALVALAIALVEVGNRPPSPLGARSTPLSVVWSPDGAKLAFFALTIDATASPTTAARELYVVGADGSGLRRLDSRPTRSAFDAFEAGGLAWAPDARHLAYSVAPAARDGSDVAIVGLDGSAPIQVTSSGDARPIAWSPDGDRLLYGRSGDVGNDLYTVAADGRDVRQLTIDHRAQGGTWSPDGSQILYEDDVVGGTQQADSATWVMAWDGSGKARLGPCCSAGWSRDGRYAYLDSGGLGLLAVPADGLGPSRPLVDLDQNSGWLLAPDGVTVAVSGDAGIVVRGSDGSSTSVTSDAYDSLLGWSPDGKYLAFLGNRAVSAGLFSVPATGGPPTLVAANAWVEGNPWRPGSDGVDRLVFVLDGDVVSAAADGSGLIRVVRREIATAGDGGSVTASGDRMVIGPDGPDRDLYSIPLGSSFAFTFENRTDQPWVVSFPAMDLFQGDCHESNGAIISLASYVDPPSPARNDPDTPPDACVIGPHTTMSVDQPFIPNGAIRLLVFPLIAGGAPGVPGHVVTVYFVAPGGS